MTKRAPMLLLFLPLAACDMDQPAAPGATAAALDGDRARCRRLDEGPFHPRLETEAIYQSEDLAFDGAGLLVAKKGELLAGVPARGESRFLSRDPALAGLSLGLRYRPDGELVVAQPAVSEGAVASLLLVHPDGTTGELLGAAGMPPGAPPLIVPNGVWADSAGGVWATDVATAHVFHVSPDGTVTTIVAGDEALTANGVLLDERRGLLFYDNTATGAVRRVPVAGGAAAGPPEVVAVLDGVAVDGLALDACGNLYVVGSRRLWRIPLDDGGAAAGPARMLAELPESVANAQFGAGPGYDPRSLYLVSIVGKVYRVPVGVAGAQVRLPH